MNYEWIFSDEIIASFITAISTVFTGLVVFLLSQHYYRHSKKVEQDKILKELFTEFNTRYDKINYQLEIISKLSLQEWQGLKKKRRKEYIGTIFDFFNLCAEEYYWMSEGRISKKVWNSWVIGMNIIYSRSEVIQNTWRKECENGGYVSYYIDNENAFFNCR